MHVSRRALGLGAAGALAAPSLVLAQAGGQNLTIATGGSITSVDPHFFNAAPNSSLALHIFGTLVERTHDAKLVPGLATSWRAVEPQLWEFKLREGVKWHDGRDFTAEDVAFTVTRAPNVPNSPGGFGGFLRSIERTEVVDRHTIRFRTHYPNPILPTEMASIFIISKHVGEGASTEDYNTGRAAIGTGAYRLSSYRPGDRTELVRNEEFWGEKEPWARVSYRFVANDAARTAALLAGDFDMVDQVSSSDLARLKREPRVAVSETVGLRVVYLMADFSRQESPPGVTDNNGQPLARNPFHDVRVRQALNMAINRQAIAERVMEGQATATSQWLPPGVFSYADDVRVVQQDIEGARRLLAEAGFPQGFRLTLHSPNDRFPNDSRIAQAVAQFWTRIGVQTQVDALPWASFSARSARQEFAMRLTSWGSVTAEAGYMLTNIMMTYDAQRRTGASNSGRFSSPELDRKVSEAIAIIDDEQRERALQDCVRWAEREVPIMPLVQLNHTWATRRGLAYQARMDERTVAMGVKPARG
ncbi:ABC transporter substrate-binding protein [Sabulicella rubraurantiaca]|uniref:ABC transporter substrate-binding protein n=1 Tax=Sabulicella rubraurantiaca TaxID=2811429 RepID=UPI001A9653E7|nr:ABC transporter substrate-binding protein [Sabulicella rubraurantiaca]